MIEKLKELWKWHRPIFMTKRKLFSLLVSAGVDNDKINARFTWAAIRPVISDLEELKKNTWDKDRVERMQKYLKENFEVEDENKNHWGGTEGKPVAAAAGTVNVLFNG